MSLSIELANTLPGDVLIEQMKSLGTGADCYCGFRYLH